jgi:aryl-alcohol dehydrogenase-like predicted oxidoreductase
VVTLKAGAAMELRPLGATGMRVSLLGLGTVKLGRTEQVKYPRPFAVPDEAAALDLLSCARELGINLIDTAPAYGNSEERLGGLLAGSRKDWVICTKVGERFENGQSVYDFSAPAVRRSVERSLRLLRTDYLDVVLIHSDGRDREILEETGALQALQGLKQKGWIRAVGISHKTAQGAQLALAQGCDVIMATLNPQYREEAAIIAEAGRRGCGVLVKKALASGHGSIESLSWIAEQPGVSSIVVGTINPAHLRENAAAVAAR